MFTNSKVSLLSSQINIILIYNDNNIKKVKKRDISKSTNQST